MPESELLSPAVRLLAPLFIEHHLRDAAAVPQVDEDEAAKIAAAMHPAHQHGASAHVRRPQGSAFVRAAQIA